MELCTGRGPIPCLMPSLPVGRGVFPLAEGVHPEQIEVSLKVRFASIRVEAEGTRAAVRFSDGTEVIVSAEELYAQTGR